MHFCRRFAARKLVFKACDEGINFVPKISVPSAFQGGIINLGLGTRADWRMKTIRPWDEVEQRMLVSGVPS